MNITCFLAKNISIQNILNWAFRIKSGLSNVAYHTSEGGLHPLSPWFMAHIILKKTNVEETIYIDLNM